MNIFLQYIKYQCYRYSILIIHWASQWITKIFYVPIYDYVRNYNVNTRVRAAERNFRFQTGSARVSSFFRFRDYTKYLDKKKRDADIKEKRMRNVDIIVKCSEKTHIPQASILDTASLNDIIIEVVGFSTVKEYFFNALPSWKKTRENLKYLRAYLNNYWMWKVAHKIVAYRLKIFKRKKYPYYWYIANKWADTEEARIDKIRKKKRAEMCCNINGCT